MIKIDTERVYSIRPNKYDAGVLESISAAHPELPDVSSLIRKALREYELTRQGGGMKVLVREIWETVVGQRHARANELLDNSPVLRGEFGECDNPPGSDTDHA